jgi:F420-dependent oxidoreductase-like protein
MKLALSVGYWGSGPPEGAVELVQLAERLGFESVWSAEAYGSDALTPLAWWGSSTSRIKLGTGIMQLSARTPTATAMAAMTMDHLSGGRFILGLGVSGPQVVEGWYGQSYAKPLARSREYIEIVRSVIRRDGPVSYDGSHHKLPLEGGTGLGKALKSTIRPLRPDLPIYLAAEGPKNVALAGELCDGWLPFWFSPKSDDFYRRALAEGFDRAGKTAEGFEVVCPTPVVIDDDIERAADRVRPTLALYVGGMGAKGANFHLDVLARMGWESVCVKVQDLYLGGRKREAAAVIPVEMVSDVALIGPVGRVRDELEKWDESVVTTLAISGPPQLLETMAGLVADSNST